MIRIHNSRYENSLYNAVEFVSRAMNKSEVRPYMRYIYKENEVLMATDGHRLHYVMLNNVDDNEILTDDGAYEIISKNKSEMILNKVDNPPVFPPSWRTVFRVDVSQYAETVAGGKNHGISKAVCDTMRLCPRSQHYNLDYILDVFKSGFTETWTVLVGSLLKPCLFRNSFKGAVVMPVKD